MTKITNTYVLDKAKRSVLLLIMLFTCPLAFAQSEPETAKPLTDMEVVHKVAFLDIEGIKPKPHKPNFFPGNNG